MRHTKDPEIDEQVRAFGESMRAARSRAGLSQVELSQATRLDRAAISFLERAERSPDLSTLVRVAAALEVKPGDLLTGIGSVGAQAPGSPSVPEASGASTEPSSASEASTEPSSVSEVSAEPASRLGANLRVARKRAGLSQEALAYEAEVDRAAISVYERGGRGPNLRTVLKLARALRLRPAVLFDGVE